MAAPPIALAGERSVIKDDLYLYTLRDAATGETEYAAWNASDTLQARITFALKEPSPTTKPLGDTNVVDGAYVAVLTPGEAKRIVRGTWRGYNRSVLIGPPSAEWRAKKAAATAAHVETEVSAVKAVLQAASAAAGAAAARVSADDIADLCVTHCIPFVDLAFPPRAVSLARDFESSPLKNELLPWQRPAAYCKEGAAPALFDSGIEPGDIQQGALGDCYLCSAIACIAEFPALIEGIFSAPRIPHLGVYRALVTRSGWYTVVTVDDLLPTRNGRPYFAYNKTQIHELWVALLEKVYAKQYGSYEAIRGGSTGRAITDMLGVPYLDISETPEWEDKDGALFDMLARYDAENYLLSVSTPGSDLTTYGGSGGDSNRAAGSAADLAAKYAGVGLVTGHAFSLIAVKRVGNLRLAKIRNPWGGAHEWNGKYSDGDASWTPELRAAVGATEAADGAFWMEWSDVWKWFVGGTVAFIRPTWSSARVSGNFEAGIPDVMFRITVTGPIDFHFGLHQRDTRGVKPGEPDSEVAGLRLLVVRVDAAGAASEVALSNKMYQLDRDVFCSGTLQPTTGEEAYYLVPQSFKADTKSYVASLFFSSHAKVSVGCVGFRPGTAKKTAGAASFSAAACSQRVAAKYQIRTPGIVASGVGFVAATGDKIDWLAKNSVPPPPPTAYANITDVALAATARSNAEGIAAGKIDVTGKVTAPAALAATATAVRKPAPPPPSAPAKAIATPQAYTITVTAISGAGLRACDFGKSDPYLRVSLQSADGATRDDIEPQTTQYVEATLDPVWNEALTFDGVRPTDVVHVHCWDRDFIGNDDDMGALTVPVAEIVAGRAAGAATVELAAKDYQLDKGTLRLAFKATATE